MKTNATHTLVAWFVMAAACIGSTAHAQTTATPSDDEDKMATALPTGIDQLQGIDMSPANLKKYLSTGRPTDDLSKQVILYNVGTRKFLNLGSYWGTHAALSDVPHIFWMQRHSDDAYSHLEYIRYPESAGSTAVSKVLVSSLVGLAQVEVGSQEGNNRSRASYTQLQVRDLQSGLATPIELTDLSDNTTHTCSASEPYSPAGHKFGTGSVAIDLYRQQLEVTADLSGIKGTNAAMENLLSIGDDIANWGNKTGGTNLHTYAWREGDAYKIRLQFVDKGKYPDINCYDYYTKDPTVKIVLSADGLYVNGERIFCTGLPVCASLAGSPSLYLGNALGGGGQATLSPFVLVASQSTTDMLTQPITLTDDGSTEIPADGKFAPDGRKFKTGADIDFSTQCLVIDVDMSTALHSTNSNENTLSIGEKVEDWYVTTSGGADMHMYFYGWPRTNADGSYNKEAGYRFHLDFTGKTGNHYKDYADNPFGTPGEIFVPTENLITIQTADGEKKVMRVVLSQEGLYIGGKKIDDDKARGYISKLLSLTHIEVGASEGKVQSHATYYTIKTENVIADEPNKTIAAPAKGAVSEVFSLDGDTHLEGTFDVSTCQTIGETALSIGRAPSEWNVADPSKANLHLRYHGRDDQGYLLEVAYAAYGYTDRSHVRYLRSADGKFSMEYSDRGLYLNGTPIFMADDVTILELPSYISGKEGDIVPYVTDSHGHLVLGTDGKYVISADGNGMTETQHTYLYARETADVQPVFLSINNVKNAEGTVKGKEGNVLAWTPSDDNKASYGNIGVFADRALPESRDAGREAYSRGLAQWTFTKVASSEQGNVYTMSITIQEPTNVEVKDETASNGWRIESRPAGTTFYLGASREYVYSGNLKDQHQGRYYNDTDGSLISDITGAEATDDADPASEYNHWKVFTIEEYYKLFEDQVSEMTNMLNLSFMLKDPDFKREHANLKYWNIDSGLAGGKPRMGYDEYYKTATDQAEYTGADNYKDAANKKARNHGRYMGVEIKSQGATGRFYQDFELSYAGWYAISCQGMSNAGAKLFVQMIDADGNESEKITAPLAYVSSAERQRLSATSYSADGLPGWPYDWLEDGKGGKEGMPFYNALVDLNDANLNDGKNVEKYNAQVAIYIDPNAVGNGKTQKLRFGIIFDGQKTDASETVAADDEWTVFDNFNLLFGGNSQEPYLLVDEDFTNMDYITSTIHHYSLRPMLINRTFSAGRWNTLILPASLTRSQFYATFGDDAQLAALDHLTRSTVEFKSVTATADDDIMLQANTPYIIKTQKANGGDTPEYVAKLYTRESNGKHYITVTSPKGHFRVENATLAGLKTDDAGQYYYEFPAGYTYSGQVARDQDGVNDDMQAYGTICKNYDKVNGKNTIIEGRPDLKGCYVMSGNNMRKMSGQYGTKGLRCWFGPTADSANQSSTFTVRIDGITDTTTGISDIIAADGQSAPGHYAHGVYNLSGQKVADDTSHLPAGIYIVNGRKQVVR